MENIVSMNALSNSHWFDKYCRQLVFNALEYIPSGCVEIIEQEQHFQFGDLHSDLQAKIIVRDSKLYRSFILGGSIGAAEAYIDGRWTTPNLTAVIRVFARAQQITDKLERKNSLFTRIANKLIHKANRNTKDGSKNNIAAHYDLGNELYRRFLDDSMMYSAAIYPHSSATLEQAQQHKLETICQRLELKENDRVMEIGTGWGGLAIYMAQQYGCHVTTTTISEEQHQYAKEKIKQLGLTKRITLLKKDYRDLHGSYDKLVSIEMIEAVGYEFLPSFFKQCNTLLKPQGKMLLQSITIADQRFDYYQKNVDFIQRYIFPGGFLPSITEIARHTAIHTQMAIESLDDIGLDYAKTLADWRKNFLSTWHELTQFGYDERFKRLWLYYFGYCEGAFLERSISTIHLTLRKN